MPLLGLSIGYMEMRDDYFSASDMIIYKDLSACSEKLKVIGALRV
jgi:hypothetical protein